jgi:hypothetical protein
MDKYLYFKSASFESNKELATWFLAELNARGVESQELLDEDYMYVIPSTIDDELVSFYLGKSDEMSTPTLWQIWPEQKAPFFKKIFDKVDYSAEEKALNILREIVENFEGAKDIEWDSI